MKTFFITLLLILLIDIPYLTLNKNFYSVLLENNKLKMQYAFIAWVVIAFSLSYFILSNKNLTNKQKIINACILGFCIYAIYNLTNLATLNIWNIKLALGDTLWGTILFGLVTFIFTKFIH